MGVGGTGPGSNTYDAPRVLAAATGASIKAVAGYPTTNDVRVGLERGEIQGMCLGWESVQSASSEWLKDGYAKVIVQNGTTRLPDLQDVPLALEFAKDEDSRTLLRLVDAPAAMAKPFALPPGVDPPRVQIMRDALRATYRDPAFLEEAKVLNLEFQPKTPDQIQQILNEVLATPPDIAAKYRQIIQP
jgi:tripartite-type tricarboxylate transporter receptor subunit TctC